LISPQLVLRDDVTIIVPVLNEADAIPSILKEIQDEGYSKILVIDGYSVDGTYEIVRDMGVRVIQQCGSGKTGALKTAFEQVDTPYLVVMDGDYTYSPRDIERFLPFVDRYDQIFGRRVQGEENIPLLNRLGNWIINKTLCVIYGGSLSDVCTGMYMMKTDVAKNLSLDSKGFDAEVEIAIQNLYNGAVTEVPISYRKRIGTSKLVTFDGFHIIYTILRMSLTYNPIFILSCLGAALMLPGGFILLRQFHLRLLYGDTGWSIGYVWLGLVLLVIGLQCFSISVFTLIIKRMEQRVIKHLKILNGQSKFL